ncbi:sugar-binding transcriptional regulator [Martelella soudanensis]|uniref:sugar-binding transcriptional regulator n=1 Tax=unclassified Martelella TaxID=2629616 RepID=UPI0015E0051F|nr:MULTISPECIES: sugar-binding domain-containing protein [unclassified Martelella]
MPADVDSFTDRILCAAAARRFYLDGIAKSDIAKELGISRFRVARLIEKALREGIVRIEFVHPADAVDYELSAMLKREMGLANAVVVKDAGLDTDMCIDSMGRVAAELLCDISGPDDILGVASTLATEAMTRHARPFSARAVVQLGGAWPGVANGQTSVEMVRRIAELTGSPGNAFYAPLVASDGDAADALRRQRDYHIVSALFPAVTLAIVGLGALREGQTSLWSILSQEERLELAESGAVGEICGQTFDRNGQSVKSGLSHRSIAAGLDQLAKCPNVLCIAFGEQKAGPIAAAIRGGIVNSLITHATVARAVLETLSVEA